VPSASWRTQISPLILLLVLLLTLDLLVTATRTGILNARHARLASLNEEHSNKAGRTLDLLKRRPNLRDSLRLALSLLRFLMAGIILDILIPAAQANASLITLGALLAIGLAIWLAEFFVERHVLRDPEAWALRFSIVAGFVTALMSPILYLPARLVNRGDAEHQPVSITEDELKSFVDASERQGVLEQDERQMIFSIFKFGDTLVREIMVPRIDIFALEIETPLDEAAAALIESGYSRVPLFEDTVDNIKGVLYVKDMLKVGQAASPYKSLRELMRQPYLVPESKKLDELLAEMQGKRMHMAIVVDEYGGVAGLVTLEDLMEEIVGEIQDEYDLGEEQSHQKINEGEYVFHGRIPLADFNKIMHSELSTENADTLGGFLFSHFGRLPKQGEQISEDGLLLTVEQITGRRIRRVRALRGGKVSAPKEKETNAQ
jgi:CBS domain containing-hemolysin-like protein